MDYFFCSVVTNKESEIRTKLRPVSLQNRNPARNCPKTPPRPSTNGLNNQSREFAPKDVTANFNSAFTAAPPRAFPFGRLEAGGDSLDLG